MTENSLAMRLVGKIMTKGRTRTTEVVMIALFLCLIIVGTFIKIPIPYVPFTFQVLFVTLAGLTLGAKRGAICIAIYILMGLIGIPIFAAGGGFSYVLQPSFGYIIGFFFGTIATGMIGDRRKNPSVKRLLTANFVGLSIIYAFGLIYYYAISHLYLGTNIAVGALMLYCFALLVPGDIVLIVMAAFLMKRLNPIITKLGFDDYSKQKTNISLIKSNVSSCDDVCKEECINSEQVEEVFANDIIENEVGDKESKN